ncbi:MULTISPECIES: multicopper oxidase family protein [Actinoalloteichus]|uniref:Multicopper oxidase CueO n=1 Tax=Actinoalloteichus fjordicus TaxID=1612552 RepID=A0AAC9LDB5_9PSEU|nr:MULTISPECIES: multicopper oxidase family protein [Actinoalloteichus]APU14234.1 putative multicopper oxidase [Actinoalloteichus fjordicus]APU20203.1 putative multicopper oxidase [Actinoalloteichus sp. GBA129-24]
MNRRSGPSVSRRGFLALTGGLGLVVLGGSGCASVFGENAGVLLRSDLPLPEPFRVGLPIPAVAEPVRTEGGTDYYELVQRAAALEIVPGTTTTIWGFDGSFPGPTFRVRSGQRSVVSVRNELPVPTSTHLHGGVTPPDSDGYATDLVVPAGYPHDPRLHSHDVMQVPPEAWTLHEEVKEHTYPLEQRAATLWYHDHRMDFSAPQVWRGLLGAFLLHDDEEDALSLPAGDKDVPLLICDRAFGADGEFKYPSLDATLTSVPGVEPDYHSGVQGDVVLVNGAPWPVMEVADTRYRFRLINASNARRYRFALSPAPENGPAFVQIGSDQGLFAAPVERDEFDAAPAERFDLVIDFSAYPVGTQVVLENLLGEEGTRQVMRFDVVREESDESEIPERLSEIERLTREEAVAERDFDFRLTTINGHQTWTINGEPFDPMSNMATPALDTVELWRFTSDFHHPVHIHLAHFQVLTRNGAEPEPAEQGWKDTVDIRPYEVLEVLVRFSGFRGRYLVHCHNLEHEDMAMMVNFEVV